ncbi:CatA-like O-acetyltransferase [Ferrimonas sp. SCSIO 43195]|uniref:CatA-like O-acetyltransferase n=1 Tax=Ferrimonas sp. SCSIO 43195 TaxID=2822844 RepID=UPI00207578E9|nr:CatA-like O-acetyltransferase [Ferrimonas sp. SCSIO 43195]USD37050.1 hypothetical protein J8Z22_18955 [Ferrimonas sp. SCSIO 43195]
MKYLDMETWPRAQQFHFFNQLDQPYFSLCADVEITALHQLGQSGRISVYHAISHAIMTVANELPWMRWRIRGQRVLEHPRLNAGLTSLGEDQQVRFTRVAFSEDFQAFSQAMTEQSLASVRRSELFSDQDDSDDDAIFMSCLPWVRFTQMTNPMPLSPADSVPRITWGQYDIQPDKVVLPLAFQIHHAIADGLHAGQFYQQLQQRLDDCHNWV